MRKPSKEGSASWSLSQVVAWQGLREVTKTEGLNARNYNSARQHCKLMKRESPWRKKRALSVTTAPDVSLPVRRLKLQAACKLNNSRTEPRRKTPEVRAIDIEQRLLLPTRDSEIGPV